MTPARSSPRGAARGLRRLRVRTLLERARDRAAAGDDAGLADALRGALRVDPRHPGALHALAELCHRRGADAEAAGLMQRLVALRPGDAALRNDLGNLLLATGNLSGAVVAYRGPLDLAPDFAEAQFNLAVALARGGRARESLALLEGVCERAPEDAPARTELGNALLHLHHTQAAARAFRAALGMDPESADACGGLAAVALAGGARDEARHWLNEALSRDPGHANAWQQLVRLRRRSPDARGDIARIERALGATSCPGDVSSLCFALATLHDQLGEPDRAFAHLQRANRLAWRPQRFDREGFTAQVSRIIEAFPARVFEGRHGSGDTTDRPVFIAGAPRSGTTLVEQIIASHPRCTGLGESTFVREVLAATGEDLASLGTLAARQDWDGLARDYLARGRASAPTTGCTTDKHPAIVFELGAIALMFPHAALIHCTRDPLDTGLSIYFQRFAYGSLPWAYDLGDIGTYLREVSRLMRHWHRVLPGRIHTVAYETLVSDQEAASRALVASCGLDWDARCLAFHATRRRVHTASAWQVREPMYRSSVGRAAAYRPHLEPLVTALGST